MINVIIIVHLLVAVGLVGVVLLQRSEGGALGIGGGGGGFLTGRGTANLLTRVTAVLAAVFILTSLSLAKLAGGDRVTRSIIDEPSPPAIDSPAEPTAPIAR
jgi:preprotein translocase subunit SecG